MCVFLHKPNRDCLVRLFLGNVENECVIITANIA